MRTPPDLSQVAIDTLNGTGTARGLALAAEIERGRSRRAHPLTTADLDAMTHEGDRNQAFMLDQLRPAQPWEWSQWVAAYLKSPGAKAINKHDRPMDRVYVAHANLIVRPLYGARSLRIILPVGITDDGGDTGHSGLYGYADNGVTYRGFHHATTPDYVPVFSDTEVTLP